MRAVEELIDPGIIILSARTGWRRQEILSLALSRFSRTVKLFVPKEG